MEELEKYIGEIKKILGFDISKEKMLETNNAILFNEEIKQNIYFLKYGIEKIYNIAKENNIANNILKENIEYLFYFCENETRIEKLKESIKILKEYGEDYILVCIDIDDVMYDSEPIKQEDLERIDFKASNKYRQSLTSLPTEDSKGETNETYARLDAILEEYPYIETPEDGRKIVHNYEKIDYKKYYVKENLLPKKENDDKSPKADECVNTLLNMRDDRTFVIYLSHINPVREGMEKIKQLLKLTPKIDGIITLPYHKQKGDSIASSKALFVNDRLTLGNLNNCILIDNSKSNCKDWRKHGGIDIRFLTTGFEETYNLEDHLLRLPSLDPYAIQFALSGIKYIRENPNYLDTINDNQKVLRK